MILPLLIALLCCTSLPNASRAARSDRRPETYALPACSQQSAEREAFIRESERQKYTVGRVEFIGNEHTRDKVLRRRMFLNEGDLFRRNKLIKSIDNLNRVRAIRPVRLTHVEIHLDKENKIVNIGICLHELHA